MKHFGWLRKAAASVLALAMFAAAPAALAYSDANLEAPRAKNVVIDGDLSEWDTSRCLRIDSEKQIVDQIEAELQNSLAREVSSIKIGEMAMTALKEVDDVAYVRFASVYRQFRDINSFMDELKNMIKEK